MQLPTAVDYAVRILQHLYKHQGDVQTAKDIVISTGIAYTCVMKFAVRLKEEGLLNAVQGRNGGYTPSKPSHEISIYDVFKCIEGDLQIRDCMQNGQHCTRSDSDTCSMYAFFCELQDVMITEMSETTIADLVS
ncbi:MAG: Rrf2 family transcriptional regulator [Oscillospiraceae bacterium]|nr:Rrf2 family transcriptional regulator [Oscillospiraceae bacterium]